MKAKASIAQLAIFAIVTIVAILGCKEGIPAKQRPGTSNQERPENMLTEQEIITIANEEATSRGLQLDQEKIYYDRQNHKWQEKFAWFRTHASDFAQRLEVLNGRDYQAVLYTPRKLMPSGVFWVFVDRQTGEVITVCGEK